MFSLAEWNISSDLKKETDEKNSHPEPQNFKEPSQNFNAVLWKFKAHFLYIMPRFLLGYKIFFI